MSSKIPSRFTSIILMYKNVQSEFSPFHLRYSQMFVQSKKCKQNVSGEIFFEFCYGFYQEHERCNLLSVTEYVQNALNFHEIGQ